MFDDKSLNTLEYPKILEMLASFAQSEGGKELARNLKPFENIEDANRGLLSRLLLPLHRCRYYIAMH